MTADDIIDETAHHFGLERAELVGPRRHEHVALARHVAMFAIRARTTASFPDIARLFGNRDHKTVMSGVRKIAILVDNKHSSVCAAMHALDVAERRAS